MHLASRDIEWGPKKKKKEKKKVRDLRYFFSITGFHHAVEQDRSGVPPKGDAKLFVEK